MFVRLILRVVFARLDREKRLGYGANYCQVCRDIRAFPIIEHRNKLHVFFIPVEKGRLLGHTQICPACQTETTCFPNHSITLAKSKDSPLETLIHETNPTIREDYREQLALAQQIASGSENMDATARFRAILESFGLAEPHFRQGGFGHKGRRVLIAALRPLRPTEAEVRECLNRFSRSRMAAVLSPEEVMISIYPELEVKNPNKFSY